MSSTARILLALVAGILAGAAMAAFAPETGRALAKAAEPIGGLWLSALRMTIVPLLFALIVAEIVAAAHAADAGGVTTRALAIIVVFMTFSAVMAAVLIPPLLDLFPPIPAAAEALKAGAGQVSSPAPPPPLSAFLANIIPVNPVRAAVNDEILPLVIFALAFGFAVTRLPVERRAPLSAFFRAVTDALLVIVEWALWIAPLGVFALAFLLGVRTGIGAAGTLLHYIAVISGICILMGLTAFPLARIVGRVPFRRFIAATVPSQALAISTQSSLACLPAMVEAATERLGIPERVAGLVLPLAVSLLRATGPAANLSVALYIAHLYGISVPPQQMAGAVAIAVVTSMGSISLPGQISFIAAIAPIVMFLGAPVEILSLLVAIEGIPDLFRTWGNVTADLSLTTMVWRGGASERNG